MRGNTSALGSKAPSCPRLLEPPADRFKKSFRQLLRQIARGVHIDVFFVTYHADQFFLPRPTRMGRNNFHAREIARQGVKMNWASVFESDAASTVGIRSQYGKSRVEHDRLAARLQHFPDPVVSSVARIEPLIGWMKLESSNLGTL